jgi:hypothetical protein
MQFVARADYRLSIAKPSQATRHGSPASRSPSVHIDDIAVADREDLVPPSPRRHRRWLDRSPPTAA